jgi:hypothetical protein
MDRRHVAALLAGSALLATACAPAPSPLGTVTAVTSSANSTPSAAPGSSARPTATPVVTMAPPPRELTTVEPVKGTTLPIAGRDGAPGLVACDRIPPNTLEAILAVPTGAENREGDEYDVLRMTIAQYGDDPEFNFRGDTFREFRPDDASVEFLGSKGHPEGPFSSISVAKTDGLWGWAGMDGGCKLTGVPGSDWGWVNWTLDPAFADPTPKTRTLHLLATDYKCVGERPAPRPALAGLGVPVPACRDSPVVRTAPLWRRSVHEPEADQGHGASARATGEAGADRQQPLPVPWLRRLARPVASSGQRKDARPWEGRRASRVVCAGSPGRSPVTR